MKGAVLFSGGCCGFHRSAFERSVGVFGPEGPMGSEKTEISARFEPCGRCEAKRDAPGPDWRVLSRSWQPGAMLSGGQPVHQEPEHDLVGAGAR